MSLIGITLLWVEVQTGALTLKGCSLDIANLFQPCLDNIPWLPRTRSTWSEIMTKADSSINSNQ
jgi:hypothetical protein